MKHTQSKLPGTTLFVACFMVISLTGCFRSFYKTNTKSSIDANTISRLVSENKYFILHFANNVSGLENVYAKDDSVHGNLVQISLTHSKYLHPKINDNEVRLKVKDKTNALAEVHLYTYDSLPANNAQFSAGLSSFYRADVYQFNKGATTENHIMSVVGLAIAFVIASCMTIFIIDPPAVL